MRNVATIRGKRRYRWMSLFGRGERGSALVEVALTAPMLCVLLVGASEFPQLRSMRMTNRSSRITIMRIHPTLSGFA